MPKRIKADYTPHHREDAQGHIFLGHEKQGAITIQLIGAAAMTQEELNFYGEKIAMALSQITLKEANQYGRRKESQAGTA